MSKGPWNDQTEAQLRQLWAEGHSTAEIGRRMGMSKNAIVGRAHRLELDGRPSPIRQKGDGASSVAPVKRRQAETLPPLPSEAKAIAAVILAEPAQQKPVPAPVNSPIVTRQSVPPIAPARPIPRSPTCCWPIGEPGTKAFRFCDDAAVPGKPYCLSHCQTAYVRVAAKTEAA